MIHGVGVDIVEIGRMRDALLRHPRLKERVFSAEERAYCDGRNRPEVHYALRFAAKEAVLKALGTGFAGMSFQDVEVLRDKNGRPSPSLHGKAAERAAEMGVVEMHLSLSYTHTTAVASAVAMTAPGAAAESAATGRPFAQTFKEMRAFVDEADGDGEAAEADGAVAEADEGATQGDQVSGEAG